jgi:hypothetical protein
MLWTEDLNHGQRFGNMLIVNVQRNASGSAIRVHTGGLAAGLLLGALFRRR